MGKSPDSSAVFYKRDTLNVVRKQMISIAYASSFYILDDVSVKMAQSISAKYSKMIERTAYGRVVGSEHAKLLWKIDNSEVLKPFLEQIKVYFKKKAASLFCSALVAYLFLVMWLNLNAKQRR